MKETVFEAFTTLWSAMPRTTEFWSAIFGAVGGAVVGGLIAYIIQVKALREGRRQRDEDHERVRHALGTSLLFKMSRIQSNIYGIHRYIEDCFESDAKEGLEREPWELFLPLANFPDLVQFSQEEMGMLLALKNDDVFNLVLSTDIVHNSLIDGFQVLNIDRRALTDRIKPDKAEGNVLSSVLDRDQMLVLRPYMIEVNTLIEDIRTRAKRDYEESVNAMDRLQQLLREKLGLSYKLNFKVKAKNLPTPENS